MCVLPGATPAASKANLATWLDNVVQSLTKHNSLVYLDPNRENGFYHHILLSELLTITSTLSPSGGKTVPQMGFHTEDVTLAVLAMEA